MPRIDLADAVSLSTGAVTRITRELGTIGVLRELDPVASTDAGRRRIPVDLDDQNLLAIGVNIGFDDIIYGLVDLRGRLVGSAHREPQRSTDPAATADQIVAVVDGLVASLPTGAQVVGTGVSVGGTVDHPSGLVTEPDVLGWVDVDVAVLLRGRVPGPVMVGSIFRALARAESWFAAARNRQHIVYVFLRHAVGAAFVFNGAVYDGARSLAGNIVHWPVSVDTGRTCTCGRSGCLMSVASLAAVVDRARDVGVDVSEPGEVRRMRDDERVAAILADRNRAVGEVLGLMLDALAPELVVISAAVAEDVDFAAIRTAAQRHSTGSRDLASVIVPTDLGDPYQANVVGTATLVLNEFYDDPLGWPIEGSRG